MYKILAVTAILSMSLACSAEVFAAGDTAQGFQPGNGSTPVSKDQMEKINYVIGVDLARNFKKQGVEVSPELIMKGLKDGLSGGKLLLSEGDLRKTMTMFQTELRRKQAAQRTIPGSK